MEFGFKRKLKAATAWGYRL